MHSQGNIEIPKNLELLSDQELRTLKVEIDVVLSRVRGQINHAKRTYASGGPPADNGWYRRAELVAQIYGSASQRIQSIFSRRKEEARFERGFPQTFQLVAREQLDSLTYKGLVAETHQRMKEDARKKTPTQEVS